MNPNGKHLFDVQAFGGEKKEMLLSHRYNLPAVIGVTPTLHRSLPNIELPHRPSLIAIFVIFAPNGGRPCEGSNAPFGIVFF